MPLSGWAFHVIVIVPATAALFLWLPWFCFRKLLTKRTLPWLLIQTFSLNTLIWILYCVFNLAATYMTGAQLFGDAIFVWLIVYFVSGTVFAINSVALGVYFRRLEVENMSTSQAGELR